MTKAQARSRTGVPSLPRTCVSTSTTRACDILRIMINALPLDHFALRVSDREAALPSFTRIGYEVVDEFEITLRDGSKAKSYALKKDGQPEIFISSGEPGSLMRKWVEARGCRGAIHHLAYAVEDVAATMEEWKAAGVKFTKPEPITCSCEHPLTQIFTEEDPATGMVYELIHRNGHPGFCEDNVKQLMDSSSE